MVMSQELTAGDVIPRVMSVEYCQRDKIRGGEWRDWTEARVLTPVGTVYVTVSGYHAERALYGPLLEQAMDDAWRQFCNVDR